ncbi:MAG: hypothetical protein KH703_00475 [Campylobacter gracilis]|uniref:hypothetical protein n=1 Tax=Campylobacter gracilis TaxID=824 RepID=UPI0026EE808B|nr:hypothetical protein [Campylobacter gracilis]MBS6151889.1 hypothetical protein [Campylobacter gracilis]
MKKSKLKAEVKTLKFWRKQYKKKLNEAIKVINKNAQTTNEQDRRINSLEFKASTLIAEITRLKTIVNFKD